MKNIEEYMDRLEVKYGSPYIQVPKNLISEMSAGMKESGIISYMAYANGFMVISGFLYKYAHYIDLEHNDSIGMADIKRMLKYNPNSQPLNKVSKKGGFLDEYGFLELTTDIPIGVYWSDEKNKGGLEGRKVVRISDEDSYTKQLIYENILPSPSFRAYIPDYMTDYGKRKGTMNDYSNTYRLTYNELKYFLFNDEMSLRDFLFYCYIKSIQDKDGYACQSRETIQKYTGMSHVTVKNISNKLSEGKVIDVTQDKNENRFLAKPKKYRITKDFKNRMNVRKKSFIKSQKASKMAQPRGK